MSFLKKQWSEAEVLNLSEGEHNFLERKAGMLFTDRHQLYSALSKTVSALANSGGGHLILGQRDDNTVDGVPQTQGRTPIREWLEQKLPNLVSYPLESFRVHTVTRAPASSQIPADRELVVIDVDDSRLAPHQASFPGDNPQYYHRQGGKSVPAPHHFLEALRNRLTFAVLEAKLRQINIGTAHRDGVGMGVVEVVLHFDVKNVSRVACSAWDVAFDLYRSGQDVPEGIVLKDAFEALGSGTPILRRDTILPTRTSTKRDVFGVQIHKDPRQPLGWQIQERLFQLEVHYYPISENHIGRLEIARIDEMANLNRLEQDIERSLEALGWN